MKIKIRFGLLCAMLLLVTACPQGDGTKEAAGGDPGATGENIGAAPFATLLSVDRTEVVFQDSVRGLVRCTATASDPATFCWADDSPLLEVVDEEARCDSLLTRSERTYRLVAPPDPGATSATITVIIVSAEDPNKEVKRETATLNLILPPAPLSLTIRAPSEVVQGVTTDGGVSAVDYAVTATVIGGTPFGVDDGLGGCPDGFAGDLEEESRYCVEWFFQGPRPEDEPISLETKAIEVLRDDGGSGEVVFATQFTAPEGVVAVYQVTARVRDKAGNVVGESRPVRIVPENPLRVETSQDQVEVEPSGSAEIDIQITGGTLPYTVTVGLISQTGASVEVTAFPKDAVVPDPDDGPITIRMKDRGPSEDDPLTLTYTAGIENAHDTSDTVTIDVEDPFEKQLPQISHVFDVVSALGFSVDVADPVLSCCIDASTSITVEIDADKGDEDFVYRVEVLSGENRISDAVDGALDAILTETTNARKFTFYYFAPNEAINEVIRITTSDVSGAESSRDVTIFVGPPPLLAVAVVAVPPIISSGGQTQLTATPGGLIGAPSYEWSVVDEDGLAGFLVENGETATWTATNVPTGGYTVIVKLTDDGRTTDDEAVATTIVVVSDQLDLSLEGIRVLPARVVRQGTRVDLAPLGLAGGRRSYSFEWTLEDCDQCPVQLTEEAPHFIAESPFSVDGSDITVYLTVTDAVGADAKPTNSDDDPAHIGVYDFRPAPAEAEDADCIFDDEINIQLDANFDATLKITEMSAPTYEWSVIPLDAGTLMGGNSESQIFNPNPVESPINVVFRCKVETTGTGGEEFTFIESFGLVIAPALDIGNIVAPRVNLLNTGSSDSVEFLIPFDFERGFGDPMFSIELSNCLLPSGSPITACWGDRMNCTQTEKLLTPENAAGRITFGGGSFDWLQRGPDPPCNFGEIDCHEVQIGEVIVTDSCGERSRPIELLIRLGNGVCPP